MVGYPVDNALQDGIIPAEGRRRPEVWLSELLRTEFFEVCEEEEHKKKVRNIYCVDCSECMCQNCASACTNASHRLLQIRRYVYQNVVQVEDMEKVLDCSHIQLFTLNGAKVVLLMPRQRTKKSRAATGGWVACIICKKMVMEPYKFCSITCKMSEEEPDDDGSSSGNQVAATPSFLPSLESDLDDVSSQQQSNLSVENVNRPSKEASPPKKRHRRKGLPQRAPFF